MLELYLEACRIRGLDLERPAQLLRAAAEHGALPGADQRGLLDWVLLLDDPDLTSQLVSSSDRVIRLVSKFRASRPDARAELAAQMDQEESPANVARAVLIAAAWDRDTETLSHRASSADPAWIPRTTLRRALRVALEARDPEWARALLSAYRASAPGDAWAASIEQRITLISTDDEAVARHGFPYSVPRGNTAPRASGRRSPETVLYAVHSSYPFHSSGYAVRTHAIVDAMRARGVDMIPVTRFGYPTDFGVTDGVGPSETFGDIKYRRLLPEGEPMSKSPLVPYVMAYADRLEDTARETGAGLLHAASNYLNGLAANETARRLGIPSVYEVRGLWEVTRASRDPEWGRTREYSRLAALETHAARDADHVITLTNALADEMIRRGISPERITVVPNGVDTEAFAPRAASVDALAPGQPLVFGYIGSLVDYEGLDVLLRAMRLLRRENLSMRARIVGDGPAAGELRALARRLRITSDVDFVGRVPHDAVIDEYSRIDVLVFPRLPLPVCHMVAPLKPYEAMALRKAVIASDVDALREIIEHELTGLLFSAGDPHALALSMRRMTEEPDVRNNLAQEAHARATHSATWATRAQLIVGIHRTLAGSSLH